MLAYWDNKDGSQWSEVSGRVKTNNKMLECWNKKVSRRGAKAQRGKKQNTEKSI